MSEQAPKPRREIWPIAIIGAFVLFALFIFTSIFFMMRSKTDLVSPTYYKEEIEFQKTIDLQARTRNAGRNLKTEILKNEGELRITFPSGHGMPEGKLVFFRPSDAAKDREMTIQPDSAYQMRLPLSQFEKGSWVLKAHWKQDGEDWMDEVKLFLTE